MPIVWRVPTNQVTPNPYGVSTRPLHFPVDGRVEGDRDLVDATSTKTYHGIAIRFAGQSVAGNVGRIQSWSPGMYARNGTHIFELGSRSWGRPVDYVPGPGSNYTIDYSRAEIWHQEIELLIGNQRWTDLVSQRDPFSITEALWRGETPYEVFEYRGCWFQSKNSENQAQGNAQVLVSGTIAFTSRIRTL